MLNFKFKEFESEYKFMIDKNLYCRINNDLNWFKEYEQINYYFLDNSEILKEKNITVRVRNLDECYRLQVKVPMKIKGSLSQKIEYETYLQELPNKIIGNELADICGCNLSDLYCIGELCTLRKTYMLFPNVKVCLDFNRYLGAEDYEIEFECKDNQGSIDDFVSKYGITKQQIISKGKFTRFWERYDLLRGQKNDKYN